MLLPLDRGRRGREIEADPKQLGVALWRRRETDKDGTHQSPTILLSFATRTYGAKICKMRHKDG